MGAQEVRWDRGGSKPAREYTFFMEIGMRVVNKGIISAVKRVQFVSGKTSYKTKRSLMPYHCSERDLTLKHTDLLHAPLSQVTKT
jgi:hypothetical protein